MRIIVEPEFQTDSLNYHVLTNGVRKSSLIPGATCEIGLRRGGGSKFIIDELVNLQLNSIKPHIAIDPYGNIPHVANEVDNKRGIYKTKQDYTNRMRNECLINMYIYTIQKDVDFYFFNMTDIQFFEAFPKGFPCFINELEELMNEYSLVHFDGPHTVKDLKPEIDFFQERTNLGAVWVFDDLEYYDHGIIDKYIKDRGWEVLEWADKTSTNHKASYIRVK